MVQWFRTLALLTETWLQFQTSAWFGMFQDVMASSGLFEHLAFGAHIHVGGTVVLQWGADEEYVCLCGLCLAV